MRPFMRVLGLSPDSFRARKAHYVRAFLPPRLRHRHRRRRLHQLIRANLRRLP